MQSCGGEDGLTNLMNQVLFLNSQWSLLICKSDVFHKCPILLKKALIMRINSAINVHIGRFGEYPRKHP